MDGCQQSEDRKFVGRKIPADILARGAQKISLQVVKTFVTVEAILFQRFNLQCQQGELPEVSQELDELVELPLLYLVNIDAKNIRKPEYWLQVFQIVQSPHRQAEAHCLQCFQPGNQAVVNGYGVGQIQNNLLDR